MKKKEYILEMGELEDGKAYSRWVPLIGQIEVLPFKVRAKLYGVNNQSNLDELRLFFWKNINTNNALNFKVKTHVKTSEEHGLYLLVEKKMK